MSIRLSELPAVPGLIFGTCLPATRSHLVDIGAVRAKRIKQWTFYKRDEERIRALKAGIVDEV